MDVFISGTSGYIGGSVAAALVARGHRESGLARSEAAPRHSPSSASCRSAAGKRHFAAVMKPELDPPHLCSERDRAAGGAGQPSKNQEVSMAQFSMQRTGMYKWQDGLNLVLAIWLFISPWVLGFYPGGAIASAAAAWNAWIFGIVVGVFAIAALIQTRPWEEWINLLSGAWIFISPFVLAFYVGNTTAMWNSLIIGALVFILSIWDLTTQPAMVSRL
jgi:hypothetical protein